MKRLHVRDIHRMQLALQHRSGALPLVFVDQVRQLIDQYLQLRMELAVEIKEANRFRKEWAKKVAQG